MSIHMQHYSAYKSNSSGGFIYAWLKTGQSLAWLTQAETADSCAVCYWHLTFSCLFLKWGWGQCKTWRWTEKVAVVSSNGRNPDKCFWFLYLMMPDLSIVLPHFYPPSQCLPAVMPRFAEQVEVAIEALSTNPPQTFEENEFIDASRLVYDGVRDIRKAVLMIRVRLLFSLN